MPNDTDTGRPLTGDDLDAIIAARAEMEAAFWHALATIHRSGTSSNEIARRVHAAGIASRPTVQQRLRAAALANPIATTDAFTEQIRTMGQQFARIGELIDAVRPSLLRAAAAETARSDERT